MRFDSFKVKNINLERPISVPEEFGNNIEIHVECSESRRNWFQEVKVADIFPGVGLL